MLRLCTSSAVSSSYSEFRVFSTLLLYNFHIGFILAEMICRDLFGPLHSAESPLLAAGLSQLDQLEAVSMHEGFSSWAAQEPFSAQFRCVSPLFDSPSVDPSTGKMSKLRRLCMRPRGCAKTHTRAHRESSVTLQNPCIGYLETGVEFLIHISEGVVIEPEVHCWPVLEGCLL